MDFCYASFFLLFTIFAYLTVFPLADKSINYLGYGCVCVEFVCLNLHTIFLVNFLVSSTEIFWVLGLGEELNPDSL